MKQSCTHSARTRSRHLACTFFITFISLLGYARTAQAIFMPSYTISDSTSGGDCGIIGDWDNTTKTCIINRDGPFLTISIAGNGVTLDGAGHTVTSSIGVNGYTNVTVKNVVFNGMYISNAPNTLLEHNTILQNGSGFTVHTSALTTIRDNVFYDSGTVVGFSASPGMTITHNTFLGVVTMVNYDADTSDTKISDELPIGGNYYSSDDSDYVCADANADGVCDAPRVMQYSVNNDDDMITTTTVTDQFPWVAPDGWLHYTPAPAGLSSVLFLPGIEASRLYEKRPSCILGLDCEDQLWEPNVPSDINDLYMNSDGTSKTSSIYTRDIIDTTNSVWSLFTQNIYKSLIGELNTLVLTGKIHEWRPYAYDWRQDVNDIISNGTSYKNGKVSLIQTLENLVASSTTGRVTIIAHSNGGLVAKALIKKLEDMKSSGQSSLIDHIDTLIMVATPQLGTPDAFVGLLHGFDQGLPYGLMPESQARILGQNMPSAYGLLPSQTYFDQAGTSSLAVFASTSSITYQNTYGTDINTYSEEHNFVLGKEGRTVPTDMDTISPIIGNSALLSQAETLHQTIDNMIFPTTLKVIEIAGWGKETVSGMTYTDSDIQPIYTIRGDKTVVMTSSLYGTGTKYWLDLSNSTISHGNIFEDPQLITFLDSLLKQEPLVFSVVTNTEPTQIGNRLHLSVHSPVSIGVYDNQGNFTGKVCDDATGNCQIEENIPGSTYYEFGEGKYVNLGQGNMQKATLQGTDAGTFTFNMQTVTPSGQATTSSFLDIPVTTQTQATITLNQTTQTPQLALDVTGDGTTDFTLTPNMTFDPVTYLEIMQVTVDSLDLTQAKIKAFDTRVENIIKLIQKGKIDKAKLKVDNFKKVLDKRLSKPDTKKPRVKKLSKTDAQTLLDMLNTLLDNLN